MARRLHAAGHRLVLWNRDQAKAHAISIETTATVARSPAEAASQADVILSSLADDAALKTVYLGPSGLVEGMRAESMAIDLSTVDPETVILVGGVVDDRGAGFLDCPVSGSVSTVEAGGLLIMAGGDPDLIARAEPLLLSFSKKVIHVGPRGAGAACKLAVNGLVHGLNIALSEALVLAERAGVDRGKAYEVFASGAGGAPFVQYKRDAFLDPEGAVVAFTLDLVAKDYELIIGLGSRLGVALDQAEASLEIVRSAIKNGMGGRDLSAVAVYLRSEAG